MPFKITNRFYGLVNLSIWMFWAFFIAFILSVVLWGYLSCKQIMCNSNVGWCQALGPGFSQYAEPVFLRCITLIRTHEVAKVLWLHSLYLEPLYSLLLESLTIRRILTYIQESNRFRMMELDEAVKGRIIWLLAQLYSWLQGDPQRAGVNYDKEFIVCSLDLLSGLAEGLGSSIESLVCWCTTLPGHSVYFLLYILSAFRVSYSCTHWTKVIAWTHAKALKTLLSLQSLTSLLYIYFVGRCQEVICVTSYSNAVLMRPQMSGKVL